MALPVLLLVLSTVSVSSGQSTGCSVSSDCPVDRSCVGGTCVDPCQEHCGDNTICSIRDHTAHCSCLRPTIVSGHSSSAKDCAIQDHCPGTQACVQGKCVDPCDYHCGPNTLCDVVNRQARCRCQAGFTGDPQAGCIKGENDKNKYECTGNSNCPGNRACVNFKCVDPCVGRCGDNTACDVVDHLPGCVCKEGFFGNPRTGCRYQGCSMKWPPGFGKKKYKVEDIKLSWEKSFRYCLEKGQRLASVLSQEENDLIKAEIMKKGLPAKADDRWWWMAGLDITKKEEYVWMTTGYPFNFTDWVEGQPFKGFDNNNWDERCVSIFYRDGKLAWEDLRCFWDLYVICEYYE